MVSFETIPCGADDRDGNDQGDGSGGDTDDIEEFRPSLIFGCQHVFRLNAVCWRRRLVMLHSHGGGSGGGGGGGGGGKGWEATGVGLVGGVFVGWGRVEGHVQGHYGSNVWVQYDSVLEKKKIFGWEEGGVFFFG